MSQRKFKTLWKVYFFIPVLFYLFWLISIPFTYIALDFMTLIRNIIGMLGLVGLYSFIWRVEIGTLNIWRAFLAFEIITFVYAVVALIAGALLDPEIINTFIVSVFVMIFLLFVPYWYALYQLSFNSEAVWSTKD